MPAYTVTVDVADDGGRTLTGIGKTAGHRHRRGVDRHERDAGNAAAAPPKA